MSHNGQIFFPEALSTKVYATAPSTDDPNTRTYRVSTAQSGSTSVLKIRGGSLSSRLTGRIALGADRGASR